MSSCFAFQSHIVFYSVFYSQPLNASPFWPAQGGYAAPPGATGLQQGVPTSASMQEPEESAQTRPSSMPPPPIPTGNSSTLAQHTTLAPQSPLQLHPHAQLQLYQQNAQQNTQILKPFMLEYFKQHPIKRADIPVIEEKPIDLTRFFAEVYLAGGYERVCFIIVIFAVTWC
jgi:hypothetical protein